METLFWILLVLSFYPYSIYPAAVYALSRLMKRPWSQKPMTPSVSLIISVYNEEKVIKQKIENARSFNYPQEFLEVIVVSDGSTDRTNEIVSRFSDPRITLKAFTERSGKTACLNRVVPQARGEIIVFTDANSLLPADALIKMTRHFWDGTVGLVTGWTKYMDGQGKEETTGLYSRLEMLTKHWESQISSCVGADGAIFALRKVLYEPLREEDINDFVIPLQVLSQNKRVILDPEVHCWERSPGGKMDELVRQARMTNRTLQAIRRNLVFLRPSYGSFSFFLFSHKLLRYAVPFFVMGTFVTNLFLLKVSALYVGFFVVQALSLLLGLAGIAGKLDGKLARICKFFLITSYAQFIGWTRAIRGTADTMWTPRRS